VETKINEKNLRLAPFCSALTAASYTHFAAAAAVYCLSLTHATEANDGCCVERANNCYCSTRPCRSLEGPTFEMAVSPLVLMPSLKLPQATLAMLKWRTRMREEVRHHHRHHNQNRLTKNCQFTSIHLAAAAREERLVYSPESSSSAPSSSVL
jgi:hypothetical protein